MVSSCGIKVTGNFDVVKFNTFMGTLLQERAKDIYRSKGVLSFEGQGAQKFVFQGVHEQIDFGPATSEWAPDEARINKLVFIGRNLDRDSLEKSLIACLV
jgi:G3E family GTPase